MRPRLLPAIAIAALLAAGPALAAKHPRHATKNPAPPPAAATSTATPASPATVAPAASAAIAKLPKADRERIGAIEQYQHDLVTVVALRADPDYLLGAAILARPFDAATPGLDFDALIQRAMSAPDAAAAEWTRLPQCKDACPNPQAFAYLQQHAGDNAAVWLVAMDVAARDKHADAVREDLHKAARAKVYDDYFGKALAGVAKAVAVLPPLPDTIKGAHDGQPDSPDGVRVLVTVMNTQSHSRPSFAPVQDLCNAEAAAKDADVKADCLKLAHTLQWGSSPMAHAVGLHIAGELAPADQAQTEQASRNLAWQVHQYSGLLQRALVDPSLAASWLAAARNGGTELSLILATLRANGVSTDAPAAGAPASAAASGN